MFVDHRLFDLVDRPAGVSVGDRRLDQTTFDHSRHDASMRDIVPVLSFNHS
jgi:hypothetical protein